MIARRSLAVAITSLLAIALVVPAVLAAGVATAEDTFDSGTYSGGSGWLPTSDWTESGDGGGSPSTGSIRAVTSGNCYIDSCIRFRPTLVGLSLGIQRSADFEDATSLLLTFRYQKAGIGTLSVRAGQTAGSLVTVRNLTNTGSMSSVSVDITDYASGTTTIMFFSSIGLLDEAYIDNVEITATYPPTTTSSTTSTSSTTTSTLLPPVTTTSLPVIIPTTSSTTTTTQPATTTTTTTTAAQSSTTTTFAGGDGGDDPGDPGEEPTTPDEPDPSQPTELEIVAAADNNVTVGLASSEDFAAFGVSSINPLTDLGVRLNANVESITTDIMSALGLGAVIAFFGVRRIKDDEPS